MSAATCDLLTATTGAMARVDMPAVVSSRTSSRRTSTPSRVSAPPKRSETYSPSTQRRPRSHGRRAIAVAVE